MSKCWHIVTGSTGAGKSTYARSLAARVGGVRFSIDEWMSQLYWMDCPEKNDFGWAMERIARCEARIAADSSQLGDSGVDAILDLGFTLREHRDRWLRQARAANCSARLHVLDVPVALRRERVAERNKGAASTYSFEVTPEMFDFMEGRWEMPDAAERLLFDECLVLA